MFFELLVFVAPMPSLDRPSPRFGLLGFGLLSVALLGSGSGCGLLIDLIDGDSVATVRLFATHAGTRGDEGFPNYGDAETTRVFVNDLGWQLALSELYVTTTAIRMVRCGEDSGSPIEMFWDACPEDFVSTNDLAPLPLGAVTLSDGDYCRLDVSFGPYVVTEKSADHVRPANPMIVGNTILITGVARRGEGPDLEQVPFEILSDANLTARISLATLDTGSPFKLQDEDFARDLTVLKTYDSLFEGVDFATATPADIEAAVLAGLELDTRVYKGNKVF